LIVCIFVFLWPLEGYFVVIELMRAPWKSLHWNFRVNRENAIFCFLYYSSVSYHEL